MKLTQLRNDDDAVSPVIGVILMVAITVMLAAVIGGMVMNMTDNVGNAGPNSNVQVSDHGDIYDSSDATNNTFLISHQNGDSFAVEDTRVIVKNGSTPTVTLGSSNGWNDTAGTKFWLQHNGNNVTGSEEVQVGDTLTINSTDALKGDLAPGNDYTVQVIHSPSDKTLIETEVTLK